MKARLSALRERIDALSLRERALLILTLLAAMGGLWYGLLYQPLITTVQHDTRQMQHVQQQFEATSARVQSLLARVRKPPNEVTRDELAQVRAQIAVTDRNLRRLTAGLIPPGQMANVLRTLLATDGHLRLIRIASLPPESLIKPVKGKKPVPIYAHGLELEFQGSFSAVQTYLERIQEQHWNLYWDSLKLHAKNYPQLSATLRVHTLGLSRAWLGLRNEGT